MIYNDHPLPLHQVSYDPCATPSDQCTSDSPDSAKSLEITTWLHLQLARMDYPSPGQIYTPMTDAISPPQPRRATCI